jgi:dolichol-phosphate mannosyltransferase
MALEQRLFVILPSYNEQENIETLVNAWLALDDKIAARGYRLSVCPIDDGSRDDTRAIIERLASADTRVTALIHPRNLGLGAGLNTGLRHFLAASAAGDAAVVMDADNTHEPKYVFPMLDAIAQGRADVVIASRYAGGSGVVGVPKFRLFLSDGARFFYTLVLGVRGVKDYTCGYRLYTQDIVRRGYARFGEKLITERSFACMMELLYKLSLVGARFYEIPFTLRYDQKGGESKMRVAKTMRRSIATALKLRFSRQK